MNTVSRRAVPSAVSSVINPADWLKDLRVYPHPHPQKRHSPDSLPNTHSVKSQALAPSLHLSAISLLPFSPSSWALLDFPPQARGEQEGSSPSLKPRNTSLFSRLPSHSPTGRLSWCVAPQRGRAERAEPRNLFWSLEEGMAFLILSNSLHSSLRVY